jgi:hypothetical protein
MPACLVWIPVAAPPPPLTALVPRVAITPPPAPEGAEEQPVTLWQNSIYGYRFWELQVPKVTLIYFKTGFACHFQDANLLISLAYPRLDDPAHALEDFFGLCIRTEKRLVHSWHS